VILFGRKLDIISATSARSARA